MGFVPAESDPILADRFPLYDSPFEIDRNRWETGLHKLAARFSGKSNGGGLSNSNPFDPALDRQADREDEVDNPYAAPSSELPPVAPKPEASSNECRTPPRSGDSPAEPGSHDESQDADGTPPDAPAHLAASSSNGSLKGIVAKAMMHAKELHPNGVASEEEELLRARNWCRLRSPDNPEEAENILEELEAHGFSVAPLSPPSDEEGA